MGLDIHTHVALYETMIGTTRPLDQIDDDVTSRPRTTVRLRRGLTGYFYASAGDAYCTDSFITWNEGDLPDPKPEN